MSKTIPIGTWEICEQMTLARKLMSGLMSVTGVNNICVAGGAIRDWKMGVPAQDLDIYLDGGSRTVTQEFLCNLLDLAPKHIQVGKEIGLDEHTKKYEGCESYDISAFKEFIIKGQTVQFMFVEVKDKSPLQFNAKTLPKDRFGYIIVSGFCVNLSKGFMEPACDIEESYEMMTDLQDNTLTISPRGINLYQSFRLVTHYLPKMQERFPDRRIIMESVDSES